MNRIRVLALAALAFLALPLATAHAGFYVGVGYRGPYHRHYRYYPTYPYRVYVAPPPVYIAPRPVYIAPAPVVVQPAPTVIQTVPAPALQTVPVPAVPFGP
jgi:hypothetical protein